MSAKKNTNLVEDINSLSQLDFGGVIKDVHDYPGHSLRTRDAVSVVSTHYTNFEVSYDANSNPTKVTYYAGTSPHITNIGFVADVAKSLNNKYFFLYEGRNRRLFHVWYNVDNTGVDPNPGGSVGIEVDISENDPAGIVAYATELVLNGLYSTEFLVRRINGALTITTVPYGLTGNTIDVNTGFFINNVPGTQEITQILNIPYSNGNPVYEGEELKGYRYNIYTGKFEFDSVEISGGSIAIGNHENFRNLTFEENILPGALDINNYTSILNYVSTEDLSIRCIKVKADTFGLFKVTVDGDIKDYYRTSPIDRNCKLVFLEDLEALTGQNILIEFIPDRLQSLSNYNFFIRIEAYI